MTDIGDITSALVRHFQYVYQQRMQGLPIVNERLRVEAIDFHEHDGDVVGILITPWFINLIRVPNDAVTRSDAQGDKSTVAFPSGSIEFTVCRDQGIEYFQSAVLFRSVSDIPDQSVAVDIAQRVMRDLFSAAVNPNRVSRRELLTGRGAR